jgi:lysozyme
MTLPSLQNVTTTSLIIDLSHYEATANLSIAEGQGNVIAVFLKATEGATYQDPAFLTLFDRARAAGLKIGVYHFGTARPPTEQVTNFIATVTRIAGGFEGIVVAIDIETNTLSPDNTMSPSQGDAWVGEFTERTRHTPLIYGGGYLRDHGGAVGHPHLANCPLWLAEYGDAPRVLPGWQAWTMWQFTDGKIGPYARQVQGIGRCDQNVYNGDRASFEQFSRAFSVAKTADV